MARCIPILLVVLLAQQAWVTSYCEGQRTRGRNRSRTADKAPKVGDAAPDFKLKSLDGKSETQLSSFKGKKPVVLFFGSYT